MIKSDFKAFLKRSPSKSRFAVIINPNFHTVFLFRLACFFYKIKLEFISKIIWYINRVLFSVDIDYRAKIEKGFVLVHGIGTVIGRDVIIGNYVTIYQGVTLGGTGKKKKMNNIEISQPYVGDNCTIYSNACIYGPCIIGERSIIGANTVLFNRDIQKNSIYKNQA
ncbi:serine O-acetyltransferase [Peribacillus sp. B2I2]|uniref:serine O-acetyltransferase n=1 Tax=Peribacillus sp. B2I2 TaxID=3156468 RepID=UPI003517D8C3